MQSKERSATYRPFKYPPDYSLARIHQKATMPGQIDANQLACPCCNQPIKKPFNTWWNRSVEKDFKQYGGGIVSYFWLSRLYCISIVLVIALYGIYLQYLNWTYCAQLDDPILKGQVCNKLFGVWIITNQDLYDLMARVGDRDVQIRFSIIRSVVFVILIATNASSLYIMKLFKSRYPDKQNVANFSLLFKNLPNDDIEYLLNQLRSEFGNFNVSEAFIVKQAQPFYTKYNQKLQLYYQCKRLSQKPKKVNKLRQKLKKIQKDCEQSEPEFDVSSRRAIIVFNQLNLRNKIFERYSTSSFKKICMFLRNSYEQPGSFYCEQCPKVQQIIWKNIGTKQKVGSKARFMSIVYFICVLSVSIFILFLLSRILYFQSLVQPMRAIVQNLILVFVVAIAIVFRKLMDFLSQMRFPYTYTNRTMFIVITTVLLHFIFYLWIPSTYLNLYHDVRGSVLNLMSNQALMAVFVQIILTYLDLFYCYWNSRKKTVENEENPFACQRILHNSFQYPRFPFQFKMIVLFKFWSLVTFFGFHSPMVLILLFLALVFHYVKDKFNLYFHYRSQMIDNQVQFNFLKIYTNLFTIYMYIIFVHTQKHVLQYILGAIVTTIALGAQLFYFRKLKSSDPHEEQGRVNLLSDVAGEITTYYKQKHDSFFDSTKSEAIDNEIKNYLSQNGGVSLILHDEDWSVMTKSI